MNKNEQGEDQKFSGIFRLNSEIPTFFRPKIGDLQKKKGLHPKNVMKSGVSTQKLRKYRWQTPIRASICTPVAPSLLISSGHSPRMGGHNFHLGGTSSHLGGYGPGMPPPRGAGPAAIPEIFYFKHDVGAFTVINFNNFCWQP